MKKRGQGEVIKYVFIAFTILAITFFGYKSLATIKDKACSAELAKFQIDLKDLDETVKFGDVKEFTNQVPCNSNEILFFDLKQRDKIISSLTNLNPIIRDSIESNVEKNIFVVKNNKILSSFYAGNLDIEFPNYLCFLPRSEKIDFIVEGHGTSVSVIGGCQQPECTYFPVETDDEESIGILNEAVGFNQESDSDCGKEGKSSCPSDVTDEFVKFLRTQENVKIFRKYEYCKETGETNVEILIKPDKDVVDKEFRFYESIPKECVDDLNKYLSTQIQGEVSIKFDPLIIWSFDDIKEEKKLRYILDAILSDDCRESIEGMGISNLLEDDVEVDIPPDAEIDEIIKEHTNLNLEIKDITLQGTSAKKVVNLKSKTTYNGDKKHLEYSILGDKENDVIKCSIKNDDKLLECESKENEQSSLTLTIQVTNGEVTAEDTLDVNVEPVAPACEDECTDLAKLCVDTTNFQECVLVDGCFKWSPGISCDVIGVGFECVGAGQCQAIVEPVCVPECTIPSKQCAGLTNFQECVLVDGCLKWSPGISCDVNFKCDGGECKETVILPKEASLSASFSNLQKNAGTKPPGVATGANWWYYDVALSETGGDIGITIQKRQRCYSRPGNNWCDPEKTDITDWYTTDYISAGNQINGPNQWVWFQKNGNTYTVTETFWGKDDEENSKQVSYSLIVTSD